MLLQKLSLRTNQELKNTVLTPASRFNVADQTPMNKNGGDGKEGTFITGALASNQSPRTVKASEAIGSILPREGLVDKQKRRHTTVSYNSMS